MVSKKIVIILFVIAIVLSVVSIAMIFQNDDSKLMEETGNSVSDSDGGSGKIGIEILPPAVPPDSG